MLQKVSCKYVYTWEIQEHMTAPVISVSFLIILWQKCSSKLRGTQTRWFGPRTDFSQMLLVSSKFVYDCVVFKRFKLQPCWFLKPTNLLFVVLCVCFFRVISCEEGKELAESWNAAFMESSAKENQVGATAMGTLFSLLPDCDTENTVVAQCSVVSCYCCCC